MRLAKLIHDLPITWPHREADPAISDLTDDSRRVTPGSLFILRHTPAELARDYVQQALANGAAALLTEPDAPVDAAKLGAACWLHSAKVDQPLAGQLAERFFDHPARQLKLIGITGTNGKTSTALIAQHLLTRAGLRTGLIGTIWIDDGQTRHPASLTTPGAIDLSRALAGMVKQGCAAAVLEASSHALEQGRTAALDFDAAVFTNLTGDHLEYHATMDAYAAAKAKLFESLSDQAAAVVNLDDPYVRRMVRDCRARVVGCGFQGVRDSHGASARVISLGVTGSMVAFEFPFGSFELRLPLIGRHNVANALYAAAATSCVADVRQTLQASLADCPAAPGRLERIAARKTGQPTVLVDYAHTHDALQNVLTALRPLTPGKLRVMFGCGGDRDKTKRPLMAKVACDLADEVLITSDNPRTEDPLAIIRDIQAGVPEAAAGRVAVEPDRARAIVRIIEQAGPQDVVLLAGKGHEDYQTVGRTNHPFDDRVHAAAALEGRS